MEHLCLSVKRLHPEANLPTKAHPGDAGWDLYAYDVVGIDAWGSLLVPTGVAIYIPYGWCGVIKDRSSVALKQSCEVGAGVIDHGYTGELKVLLRNLSPKVKWFDKGDRIAQLLILPVPEVTLVEVKGFEEETARGDGGFGSTGK
jgi:dUTP pyrophosphatase